METLYYLVEYETGNGFEQTVTSDEEVSKRFGVSVVEKSYDHEDLSRQASEFNSK